MRYALLLVLAICLNIQSIAQTETKKVVIIKKVKDENGKVSTNKIKASGKEADEILKKMKADGELEGIDIEVEIEEAMKEGNSSKSESVSEDLKIEKKIENGKEVITYKLTTTSNGDKEVIVWNGDGEMPEKLADKVRTHKMVEIQTDGDQEMIFITEMEDDEDIEIHKEVRVEVKTPNKVTLGVIINDDKGIVIDEIVEGSIAAKAGLIIEDTILKIDGEYLFNTNMLLNSLSTFDKGDSCHLTYLRGSEEKTIKIEF